MGNPVQYIKRSMVLVNTSVRVNAVSMAINEYKITA